MIKSLCCCFGSLNHVQLRPTATSFWWDFRLAFYSASYIDNHFIILPMNQIQCTFLLHNCTTYYFPGSFFSIRFVYVFITTIIWKILAVWCVRQRKKNHYCLHCRNIRSGLCCPILNGNYANWPFMRPIMLVILIKFCRSFDFVLWPLKWIHKRFDDRFVLFWVLNSHWNRGVQRIPNIVSIFTQLSSTVYVCVCLCVCLSE